MKYRCLERRQGCRCGELPVVPGDRELQDARDRDPDEIRDLREGDPAVVWPNGFHGPEDRDPDDCDVEGGEGEVSQTELDRGKGDVGDQVNGEWDRHGPRDLPAGDSVEDVAECDQDDRVQYLPDQADRRRFGSPSRFIEGVVSVSPCHQEKHGS